jgi:mono/diheme cytochrome c family protein
MRPVAWLIPAALGILVSPAFGANDIGQKMFKERCTLCHQEDAHGAAGVAPSLVGTLAPYLASAEGKRYLAQILISGMIGPIDTEGHKFSGMMPSFRSELSDSEIAATINYVLGTFNGVSGADETAPIAPGDVTAAGASNPVATGTRALRQSLKATLLSTVYTLNCSGCHGAEGVGVPEVGIPDLNEAGLFVRTELGREYLIQVPGLSQSRVDDATAARLLNWILRKFSAARLPIDFRPYTAEEVARFRADKASDPKVRRDAILAEMRRRGLLDRGYSARVSAPR